MSAFDFERLKLLREKRGRDEFGYFLAEGEHLVLELVRALERTPALRTATILAAHDYEAASTAAGNPSSLPLRRMSAKQIEALSETRNPQGIIAVVPITPASPPCAGERCIYLHEIQDPGNLGTILRTLGWFGKFRCLLSPQSVDPYNSKVVRASMGAIFTVPIERDVEVESLIERCPRLALLDLDGTTIDTPEFQAFDGYVFGNEARGLPADLRARLGARAFSIPGGRRIESLNLAAAVNICTYELTRGAPITSNGKPITKA
jgi:TrmH family RNA methyltransferase